MAKHAIGMMNNDKLKLVDIQKKAPRYRIAKPFCTASLPPYFTLFFYQIISPCYSYFQ